jgi:hypothetical protein
MSARTGRAHLMFLLLFQSQMRILGPVEILLLTEADRTVLQKRSTSPTDDERLAREAAFLTAAAGVDGIPRLLRRDATSLTMSAAAGPSVLIADPLGPRAITHVAHGVARTLAALHERDLVHGAVIPGHVVLDGDGPPVLCGLAAGGTAGTVASDDTSSVLQPEDDIAGWGETVAHLLDYAAAGDDVADVDGHAGRRARRRAPEAVPDERAVREELAARADDARHPDPHLRPSAHALAAAIEHRLGALLVAREAADDEVATVAGPRPRPIPRRAWRRGPRRRGGLLDRLSPAATTATATAGADDVVDAPPGSHNRRLPWLAGVGVGCVALLLVVARPVLASRLHPDRPSAGAATGPARGCPPVAAPAADVDGDGCEEAVRWSAGVLEAGSARFAIGAAGDAVVVGDWDCDGGRTAALLTGERLVVFDAWADPGADLVAREVATVEGANGLAVVRGADGCERPSVSRAGIPELVVEVKP